MLTLNGYERESGMGNGCSGDEDETQTLVSTFSSRDCKAHLKIFFELLDKGGFRQLVRGRKRAIIDGERRIFSSG